MFKTLNVVCSFINKNVWRFNCCCSFCRKYEELISLLDRRQLLYPKLTWKKKYCDFCIEPNNALSKICFSFCMYVNKTIIAIDWSLKNFQKGFPHQYKTFWYITCTFNARVSGYLDLKFHNMSPFWLKIHKIYRKYATRWQIVKFLI